MVFIADPSGEEYAYNMSFRIIRQCWHEGYENNTTEEYKNMSNTVKLEVSDWLRQGTCFALSFAR